MYNEGESDCDRVNKAARRVERASDVAENRAYVSE